MRTTKDDNMHDNHKNWKSMWLPPFIHGYFWTLVLGPNFPLALGGPLQPSVIGTHQPSVPIDPWHPFALNSAQVSIPLGPRPLQPLAPIGAQYTVPLSTLLLSVKATPLLTWSLAFFGPGINMGLGYNIPLDPISWRQAQISLPPISPWLGLGIGSHQLGFGQLWISSSPALALALLPSAQIRLWPQFCLLWLGSGLTPSDQALDQWNLAQVPTCLPLDWLWLECLWIGSPPVCCSSAHCLAHCICFYLDQFHDLSYKNQTAANTIYKQPIFLKKFFIVIIITLTWLLCAC